MSRRAPSPSLSPSQTDTSDASMVAHDDRVIAAPTSSYVRHAPPPAMPLPTALTQTSTLSTAATTASRQAAAPPPSTATTDAPAAKTTTAVTLPTQNATMAAKEPEPRRTHRRTASRASHQPQSSRQRRSSVDRATSPDMHPPPPPVKFVQLFRYTRRAERLTMLTACISAFLHGSIPPCFSLLFGQIIDGFNPSNPLERIREIVASRAKWFVVLGVVAFASSFVQVRSQLVVAQRVAARLRRTYFRSLLAQEAAWFSTTDQARLASRMVTDIALIEAGIGEKLTSAVQFFATFFVGFVIALSISPLLTLVVLAIAPLLIIGGVVFAKLTQESTSDGLGAYAAAAAVATEVIALIRTVTAYNAQESEIKRYEVELQSAYRSKVKKAIYGGLGLGFTIFVIFCAFAIAFSFGASRVRAKIISTGDILTTLFAVIFACIYIGQAAPILQSFAAAKSAAPRVFEVIERQSEINPLDDDSGDTIPNFQGRITFSTVDFAYDPPDLATPDASPTISPSPFVLNNFDIDILPGTSHAFVGPSGCGKSTAVQLIERLYDVQHGSVSLDGRDVRSLNVRWLRAQIGYVAQMPSLFRMSIGENIALGAAMVVERDEETGKRVFRRKTVSESEIVSAAKMANAHDFISKLPDGYDTILGERGALLSGGQKQRVCIARALVRNPKVLILDESTAALDAQSERQVQEALEQASAGRTTITIAHRLSTVINADVISAMDKGRIIESGSHAELMSIRDGLYRTLIEHQNIPSQQDSESDSEDDVLLPQQSNNSLNKAFSKGMTHSSADIFGQGGLYVGDDRPVVDPGVFIRALKMNASEWPFMLAGSLGAAVAGSAFPIMAVVFSEILFEILYDNSSSTVRRLAFLYVAIGGGAFFGNFFQLSMVEISGERLTRRLRLAAFKAILRQEISFFDMRENSLGALTMRLATEASEVQGMTGGTLGGIAFCTGAVSCGFLVAYLACWRVALVVTAVFPLMVISWALQVKLMTGFDADSDKRYLQAAAVAAEALDNFDTVTSIGVQDHFIKLYDDELVKPLKNGARAALIAGVSYSISEFLSQSLWAVSFWVGSIFVENGHCDFAGLMKAVTSQLFAGLLLGPMSIYLLSISKARVVATNMFRLLDRPSAIDPTSQGGQRRPIDGKVALKGVRFEYPTRQNVPVLRGLSVRIAQGKMLALVGASGCGKSTVVALLERFYDPRTGEIRIDDSDVISSNLSWFRKQVGLVSQEPDLFNRSVRDNIAYGLDHEDGTVVTDEVIENAAKEANAHSFITELPEGYDTLVGRRGSKLSGGQRQRIAIARAIVRQPKILLLDEATSALDAVSEHAVQEALEHAGSGRTIIAIAHRLSTIKNADVIAVVARGKIVEMGTHEQLSAIHGGEYATLVKNQLAQNFR